MRAAEILETNDIVFVEPQFAMLPDPKCTANYLNIEPLNPSFFTK